MGNMVGRRTIEGLVRFASLAFLLLFTHSHILSFSYPPWALLSLILVCYLGFHYPLHPVSEILAKILSCSFDTIKSRKPSNQCIPVGHSHFLLFFLFFGFLTPRMYHVSLYNVSYQYTSVLSSQVPLVLG